MVRWLLIGVGICAVAALLDPDDGKDVLVLASPTSEKESTGSPTRPKFPGFSLVDSALGRPSSAPREDESRGSQSPKATDRAEEQESRSGKGGLTGLLPLLGTAEGIAEALGLPKIPKLGSDRSPGSDSPTATKQPKESESGFRSVDSDGLQGASPTTLCDAARAEENKNSASELGCGRGSGEGAVGTLHPFGFLSSFGSRGGKGGKDGRGPFGGPKKALWQPQVSSPFQIVLSGVLDMRTVTPSQNASKTMIKSGLTSPPALTPGNVEIFDIDLWETPTKHVERLHQMGKKVICYFSAGTSESWRPDFKEFRPVDMGADLPMWRGEKWLDIRSKEVWKIMQKRILLASRRGCDAVDPDNVDGYDNEKGGGFARPLTKRDTIAFMRKISKEAARYGMSTGLKNAADVLRQLDKDVHFAVNEECAQMAECDVYDRFVAGGRNRVPKPVFHIEYVNVRTTTRTPQMQPSYEITNALWPNATSNQIRKKVCLGGSQLGNKLSTVIKEMNLNGWVMYCDGSVTTTKTMAGNTGPGPGLNLGRGSARNRQASDEHSPDDIDDDDFDLIDTVMNAELIPDDEVWELDVGPMDEADLQIAVKPKGAGKDRIGPDGPHFPFAPEDIGIPEKRWRLPIKPTLSARRRT